MTRPSPGGTERQPAVADAGAAEGELVAGRRSFLSVLQQGGVGQEPVDAAPVAAARRPSGLGPRPAGPSAVAALHARGVGGWGPAAPVPAAASGPSPARARPAARAGPDLDGRRPAPGPSVPPRSRARRPGRGPRARSRQWLQRSPLRGQPVGRSLTAAPCTRTCTRTCAISSLQAPAQRCGRPGPQAASSARSCPGPEGVAPGLAPGSRRR